MKENITKFLKEGKLKFFMNCPNSKIYTYEEKIKSEIKATLSCYRAEQYFLTDLSKMKVIRNDSSLEKIEKRISQLKDAIKVLEQK